MLILPSGGRSKSSHRRNGESGQMSLTYLPVDTCLHVAVAESDIYNGVTFISTHTWHAAVDIQMENSAYPM